MKKTFFIVLIALILIIGISIEKDNIVKTTNTSSASYITYGMKTDKSDLKLTKEASVRDKDLLLAFFDGLIKKDEEGKIVPSMAREYSVSEDGLEYTFVLKDDLTYSNGDSITSTDFKEFFKEFLSDKDNIYRDDLSCIFGVQGYIKNEVDFSQVAINCPDDKTLVIRLNYPCYKLLSILSSPVFFLRDYDDLNDYKLNYEKIRFSGPFVIKNCDEKSLLISKNAKYYDYVNVTDEIIRIVFFNSIEEPLALFESSVDNKNLDNNVDILLDVPSSEVSRLYDEKKLVYYDCNDKYFLSFNMNKEDINFRKAIISSLKDNKYIESTSDLAISSVGFYDNSTEVQQVFLNNTSLDEGKKYFENWTGSELNLAYEKDPLNRQIATGIEDEIKKAFDIKVNLIECTNEEIKDESNKEKYHMILEKFQGKYGYVGEYLYSIANPLSYNKFNYNDSEYKKLLGDINISIDAEVRNIALNQCEDIIESEYVVIPICALKTPICINSSITGVKVTKAGNIMLNNIKRSK
ncbi:MAG: ABC transporter substrate-binding protein [Clostridium sp.]|nr:ABC transporter substrate-binding protein [Clostridium sp.]